MMPQGNAIFVRQLLHSCDVIMFCMAIFNIRDLHFFRALQRSGLHGTGATGDEAEALSSLSAAILLHTKGNLDKARKLFRHALALCPKHPKILNHYGEFLETSEGRILQVTRLV